MARDGEERVLSAALAEVTLARRRPEGDVLYKAAY